MPQSDQCILCRHYQLGHVCAAFPDGIPRVIISGEFDHRKAYPGDHGIRFEPSDGGPNDGNAEPEPNGQPRERLVALFRAAKALVTREAA